MNKRLRLSLLVVLCLFYFACEKSISENKSTAVPTTQSESIAAEITMQQPIAMQSAPFQMPDRISKKMAKDGPKPQSFIAHTDSTTIINCEQGSRLKFPAGIFVYAGTQEPVEGDVDIEVTEYVDLPSILFAQLVTKAGNEIIETAGMMKIEASIDGRSCDVKEGEYYEIEIPSNENKDGMELFYGDAYDGQVNWIPASRGRAMEDQNYNSANSYFFQSAKKSTAFKGGLSAMYEYLNKEITFPEWAQNVELKAVSYVSLTLDCDGKISKVKSSPYHKTYADSAVVNAFRSMPAWDVPNMSKSEKKKIVFPVKLEWVKNPGKIPVKQIYDAKPKEVKFSAMFQADRYIMGAQQLGWINCDRFYNNPKPRTQFFVEMDSTVDATVRIVFNDYNSILGGIRYTKGFVFDNVPVGEKITIVALKLNGDKYELAMKECKLTAYPVDDLEFETLDKEMLVERFKKLYHTGGQATASNQSEYINPVEKILKLFEGSVYTG